MSEKNNGSLEKIDAINQKTWSPPEIKHLNEISETEAGPNPSATDGPIFGS